MEPIEENASRLRQHITATYLGLRAGIAVMGILLPILLGLGGRFLNERESGLLTSISIYYHTPMRDVLVGTLIAVGVCLYLYKGFSRQENWALNLAGVLAVCVALVPTRNLLISPEPALTWWNSLHLASALLFFGCIGYVSIFRASDTLSLVRNTERARALQLTYRSLGSAMIVLPVFAAVLAHLSATPGTKSPWIFGIETGGVWAFGAYWITKSWELAQTEAQQAAIEGKLRTALPPKVPVKVPGRLVQIAPLEEDLLSNVPH